MQQLIDKVRKDGFYIGLLSEIFIAKNSVKLNTSEFLSIYLVDTDTHIKVENKTYEIVSGNAIFVGPHKEVEFDLNYKENIYLIIFKKEFLNQSSKESIYLKSKIFFDRNSPVFISPQYGSNDFKKVILIERLSKFSKNNDNNIYNSAVHNAIESLILDAYLHIENQEIPQKNKLDSLNIANKFIALLQRDYKKEKKASYYANELRISTRKLTDITEIIFGKSSKQIIIDKLARESQYLIQNSNKTFSDIAFELGFNDEGNFSNFIKKHLGKKPKHFREKT